MLQNIPLKKLSTGHQLVRAAAVKISPLQVQLVLVAKKKEKAKTPRPSLTLPNPRPPKPTPRNQNAMPAAAEDEPRPPLEEDHHFNLTSNPSPPQANAQLMQPAQRMHTSAAAPPTDASAALVGMQRTQCSHRCKRR
eukprot:4589018-Pleurochrysis_carterae.AAC.4